ncbi:MAG: DNA topoisomerase 1 [Candidatus Thorarchaeota archaeon]|nr:MAG: DNA topoisomerase 1 [Candidatus Thorarchaeota archaeon]
MSKIMIITEKPTAAKKIAEALDEKGSPKEVQKRKASYFECSRNNDILIVVYALGHLFELKQTEPGWKYPRLDTEWVPKYEVIKKDKSSKPLINLMNKLAKDIDQFIVATDYDIEGSLIGYLSLVYACNAEPNKATRMIFSTLTKKDIVESYESPSSLDFPMIDAGQVRHEVDWLYGINLTRALTLSVKNVAGWFKIISTGRVQGPTLSFVAKRDYDINVYVPTPFWGIKIIGEYEGTKLEIEFEKKKIETLLDADNIVKDLRNTSATIKAINRRKRTQSPPSPFNLSGLQSEAYRHFGFKPSRTLALAQKLYLDALISYPRTSSQKIPESIDVKQILKNLETRKKYSAEAKQILKIEKLIPKQGEKTDPAHPAIHPTGNKPTRRLTPSENKLYDLIVRRFFALFGEPAVKESIRADLVSGKHKMYLRGLRIIEYGWMRYYKPYAYTKEKEIPSIIEGESLSLTSIEREDKFTSPPARYNPSSLLKVLERKNLGTKSTRSGIVDSLRSRGYTLNDTFEISTLGYATLDTLETYVPRVLSIEFTRHLEEEMGQIQDGAQRREEVLAEAKRDLLTLLKTFKEQEKEIGQALVAGLQRYWKAKEELGPCPACEDGTLIIIKSPKTGKRFVGCTNYREKKCEQTFALPQKGIITPLEKECPHCGHIMFQVRSGRRKWETCVNWTECPGRQEDIQELEKRRKQRSEKKEDKK